jgi:hypothetical protein
VGKQRDSRTIGSKPSDKTPIADKIRREVQHPYGKGNTHPTKTGKIDSIDPT